MNYDCLVNGVDNVIIFADVRTSAKNVVTTLYIVIDHINISINIGKVKNTNLKIISENILLIIIYR